MGTLAWAWQSMRGHAWVWAHSRAKEGEHCGVPVQLRWTRLCQTSPAIDDPASDHAESTTDAHRARKWSMRMGTWRGHTFIFVLDQLESAQSQQASEQLDWCRLSATSRMAQQDICL